MVSIRHLFNKNKGNVGFVKNNPQLQLNGPVDAVVVPLLLFFNKIWLPRNLHSVNANIFIIWKISPLG